MTTLCLDFEREEVFEVDPGLILDGFTERHHVNSIPLLQSDHQWRSNLARNDVILTLSQGVPSKAQLRTTAKHLRRGSKVYYYWPAEDAIEVVTPERLRSFRRHWLFLNLYQFLSRRRMKQAAEQAAGDAQQAGDKSWSFLNATEQGYQVSGKGMYIRLDYWAKLKGGGSYGHTCYQAKALNEACSEGLICVLASEYELLRDMGIHQIVLPSRNELADEYSLVENGRSYDQLIERLIEMYRPKFVFERLVLGNSAAARACEKLNIPYVAEFNGSELMMSRLFGDREMANAEVLQQIENDGFGLADVVSVVSDPVADMVVECGVPREKILTNPNGVDLTSYGCQSEQERQKVRGELGIQSEDVLVGFCGTFGGWHGIEVLAEAIPEICGNLQQAKVLLIGDGNFKHLVTDQVEKFDLKDRVVDLGMVEQTQAARYLSACDVLLSPHSKNMGDRPFFGSPTKLFEYMAMGVGIVCSDLVQLGEVMRPAVQVEDLPDVQVTDERGVLVQPGSVEDLVKATLWLCQAPQVREKLGRNAREAAQQYYSWDIHVQTLFRFVRGENLLGYHIDRSVG